jgi:SAM-dependent methyltransferase
MLARQRRRASIEAAGPGYAAGVEMRLDPASQERFSGFADLYDISRPSPPALLGPLLACYANVDSPAVVDIGSGTGLSSRWAATWAASVKGVEPNADMRKVADSHPAPGVEYLAGLSHQTGLAPAVADVVTVVQAMHWMDPDPTLAEVARILRPGGLLAIIDADWPPVSGVAGAEDAWRVLHERIRVLEARVAAGESGDGLRQPITDEDPALVDDDLADPHRNRVLPGGLRSWSKSGHLDRMKRSGHFGFTRELALSEPETGGVERFCALMYSQGSYQGLRRQGLSDDEIGAPEFEQQVRSSFAAARSFSGLSFTWRVRLGVTSR